jgi:flavin reductase (DIM6/NTAB) family NADH-FMN oxidoreductase RutF
MVLAAPSPAAAAPDARSFRDAVGRFATGVAFVAAAPDGEPSGPIVNSLTSVSREPPLLSFCPSRSSLTRSGMRRTRRFGVNVLGRQHERFARGATPAGADRFAGLDWELKRGGVPLLTDALASLTCEIVAELERLLSEDEPRLADGIPPAITGSSSGRSTTCASHPSRPARLRRGAFEALQQRT